MFNNDRDSMRKFYCECWEKRQSNQLLSPMESQLVSIIEQHPEYHTLLENPDGALGKEYLPEMGETNPFLHMSMHMGLREQVATDRPIGIKQLYEQIIHKMGQHEGEHELMDCLAEALWSAQQTQMPPDDLRYLACIKDKIERLK